MAVVPPVKRNLLAFSCVLQGGPERAQAMQLMKPRGMISTVFVEDERQNGPAMRSPTC